MLKEEDICYICHGPHNKKEELVMPCDQCNAYVHMKCIQEQLEKKDYNCGNCRKKFETTTKKQFDRTRCLNGCGYGMIIVIMAIINCIGLPLLYLGSSITDFGWIQFAALLLLVPPVVYTTTHHSQCCCAWYWTVPCWRWYTVCVTESSCICTGYGMQDFTKKMNVIQLVVTVAIEIVIVVSGHLIGNPILIWLYDIDEWFTWRTGLAGLVVWYIVLTTLLIIYFGCYCLALCFIDHYSEQTVVIKGLEKNKYGSVVNV